MAAGKNSRNQSWIERHVRDPYVKQSKVDGLRSRAAYKLLELQEKYRFIKQGMTVVDLGSAPGSWTQVAKKCAGEGSLVIAVDLLEMDPLAGVEFKQADFTNEDSQVWIHQQRQGKPIDVVISDMAPNLSGVWVSDQARSMNLAEQVWWFADEHLIQGGSMLIKVFQGSGIDDFVKMLRTKFTKVVLRKPKASRAKSRECYLLAIGRK